MTNQVNLRCLIDRTEHSLMLYPISQHDPLCLAIWPNVPHIIDRYLFTVITGIRHFVPVVNGEVWHCSQIGFRREPPRRRTN